MAATDAQILASARDALKAILDGKAASYSINGRTYAAQNITELRNLIRDYESKVARATRGAFELGSFGCG